MNPFKLKYIAALGVAAAMKAKRNLGIGFKKRELKQRKVRLIISKEKLKDRNELYKFQKRMNSY